MGRRNILVDGVSGAGKTSVAEELARRGHHVVHGDRTLARAGDPATGAPLDPDAPLPDDPAWRHAHWIWDEARVAAVLDDATHPVTFLCGGARNHARHAARLDAVFVLVPDPATLRRRLAGRGADEFGGRPDEMALVLRLLATGEGLAQGEPLDATRPLAAVVDDLLARCGLDPAGPPPSPPTTTPPAP